MKFEFNKNLFYIADRKGYVIVDTDTPPVIMDWYAFSYTDDKGDVAYGSGRYSKHAMQTSDGGKIIGSTYHLDGIPTFYIPTYIDTLAYAELKPKWSHLYQFGYPQRNFPKNFEHDFSLLLSGLQKSNPIYDDKSMIEFAHWIRHHPEYEMGIVMSTQAVEMYLERYKLATTPKLVEIEIADENLTLSVDKKISDNERCLMVKLRTYMSTHLVWYHL